MAEYSLSQNPNKAPKIAAAAKKAKHVLKLPFAKLTKPYLVIGGIVIVLLVFLAVLVLARPTKSNPGHSAGSSNQPLVHRKGKVTAGQPTYNLPPATYSDITSTINNRNVTNLGKYYGNGVRIVDLFSHLNVFLAPNQASILIASSLYGATSPWNFQIPANELAAWQNGPYGQYFTGNDLVGISNNGYVLSIQFDSNGQIISEFIAPITTLSPTGGSNTGSNTGSSTTSPSNPINGPNGGE